MFGLHLVNSQGNEVNVNDGLNYIILGIDGLNPPKATIFGAKSPNRKGVKYAGSTIGERTVSISIKPLGDVEANRNALYEWADTEQYVKILYRNGLKNVYAEGHIEECEVDFFSERETIELTILCEDPYFKEMSEIRTEISKLLRRFTFPFSIDSKGIPISILKFSNETAINNTASETGLSISIVFNGKVVNPAIYDSLDRTRYIRINGEFSEGEMLVVKTDGSPKTILKYTKDGKTENILRLADKNIAWFMLKKGLNKYEYRADEGLENMDVVFSYRRKYLGV